MAECGTRMRHGRGSPRNPGGFPSGMKRVEEFPRRCGTRQKTREFHYVWEQGSRDTREAGGETRGARGKSEKKLRLYGRSHNLIGFDYPIRCIDHIAVTVSEIVKPEVPMKSVKELSSP